MILLSFGHGYSAAALEPLLLPKGWEIIATTRNADKAKAMAARGITARIWGRDDLSDDIKRASHILSSIAPDGAQDPVLSIWGEQLETCLAQKTWVGYLSTTGVYGDRGGDWVSETDALHPTTARGQARVAAEAGWTLAKKRPLLCISSVLREFMAPSEGRLRKFAMAPRGALLKMVRFFRGFM